MPKGEARTPADKKTAGIGKGTPGPGRPKGVQNKTTTAAKEAFRLAFDRIGGYEALGDWAAENRTEFYKLYARLIPVDLTSDDKPLAGLVWAFGDRKVEF